MKTAKITGVKRAGAMALVLLLAACGAGQNVILPGEREPLREEGDRFAAAETENRAVPIRLATARLNADWTHRGGSATHRIAHPELGGAPALLWTADIGEGDSRRSRITADPIVADGRIFTLDALAQVTATATSGATLWTADLTPARDNARDASGGGLAYGNGTLFVSSAFGILSALDPATGDLRWTQKLQASGAGAPTVAGDLVYLVSRDNRAWAVEADTGRIRWTLDAAPSISGSVGGPAPAVSGDLAVFPFSSGDLIATFRNGGLRRWQATVTGQRRGFAAARISDLTGDPVIDGNTLYAANQSGRVAALVLADGERLWTAREGALSPVWPAAGSVFLISDRNELVRLDASDGSRIWGVELPFFTKTRARRQKEIYAHYGPIIAGGRLVVASNDGLLRFFDPASGAALGQLEVPGGATTAPVVANGTLYVVGTRGQLHAFR